MSTILSARQLPNEAILDTQGKQAYLGNAFTFPFVNISLTGSSEQNVALMSNASSSANTVFVYLRKVSSLSQLSQFKFYIGPTVTNVGTIKTPLNIRPLSSTTSAVNIYQAPSTSSKGTLLDTMESPTDYYITEIAHSFIIIDPGVSLLVTSTPASDTIVNINIGWYELPYGSVF